MSSSLSTIDQRFKGRRRSSWFSTLMGVIRDGTNDARSHQGIQNNRSTWNKTKIRTSTTT
ncbi:MAG: hypothetical protein WA220_00495 [Candidatus Nitrosopolaris sp.]